MKNNTKSDTAKALNNMKFMTVEEVKEQIANNVIVTLTFIKKNGEVRVMKASRNWEFLKTYAPVTCYEAPNGKGLSYDNTEKKLVTVYDMEVKKDKNGQPVYKDGKPVWGGFKQVPADRMLSIVIG